MQIGALAEAVGLTTKTIRFYEEVGLIPNPPRTLGGYRDYPASATQRLRFIRYAQNAGLSLAEIRSVLALRDAGQAPCGAVAALIDEHLDRLERRLRDLQETRQDLRALARLAAATDPAECAESEICTILTRPVRLAGRPGQC